MLSSRVSPGARCQHCVAPYSWCPAAWQISAQRQCATHMLYHNKGALHSAPWLKVMHRRDHALHSRHMCATVRVRTRVLHHRQAHAKQAAPAIPIQSILIQVTHTPVCRSAADHLTVDEHKHIKSPQPRNTAPQPTSTAKACMRVTSLRGWLHPGVKVCDRGPAVWS